MPEERERNKTMDVQPSFIVCGLRGPVTPLLSCLSGCHVTLMLRQPTRPLQLSTTWSDTDHSVACWKAAAVKRQSLFGATWNSHCAEEMMFVETGRGSC